MSLSFDLTPFDPAPAPAPPPIPAALQLTKKGGGMRTFHDGACANAPLSVLLSYPDFGYSALQ